MSLETLMQKEEIRKRKQRQKELKEQEEATETGLESEVESKNEEQEEAQSIENINFVSRSASSHDGIKEVVLILDKSGSMADYSDYFMDGYDQFLTTLELANKTKYITVTTFNDEIQMPVLRGTVAEARDVLYIPEGITRLYDAIGETIYKISESHSQLLKRDVPEQIICAIITDGLECGSVNYSLDQIKKMIKVSKDLNNWKFVFLGATPELEETAKEMGIDAASDFSFTSQADFSKNVFDKLGGLLQIGYSGQIKKPKSIAINLDTKQTNSRKR